MRYPLPTVLLAFTLFALAPLADAQTLTLDEVLDNIRAAAEATEDATFVLTGMLTEMDGSVLELEIDTRLIPELQLGRAEFILPDALADNFIIVDDRAVYNYTFLTNQVTILNTNDPDALGGLFPTATEQAEEAVGDITINPDIDRILDAWEASLEGYDESPVGNVYLLRFDNRQESANVVMVNASFVDETWTPYRLEFVQQGGSVLAEFFFNDVVLNSGLEPSELRFIPRNAEVIDER